MASTVVKSNQTPRNHRSSGRERQASIIAAAASLFAQKGFNGTTTREIAKTAGISEALLFRYFPTKSASDRKSTRLNSSHVAISYAVFCLKKKKKQHKTFGGHKKIKEDVIV